MVELLNWGWINNMQIGGDSLALYGQVYNHPNYPDGDNIIPSHFVSFDKLTKTGVSFSGRQYKLDNFLPTGNAPTEEIAIQMILDSIEQK